jgi:hypothetical protein
MPAPSDLASSDEVATFHASRLVNGPSQARRVLRVEITPDAERELTRDTDDYLAWRRQRKMHDVDVYVVDGPLPPAGWRVVNPFADDGGAF